MANNFNLFLRVLNENVQLTRELLDAIFTLNLKQLVHVKHNVISYFSPARCKHVQTDASKSKDVETTFTVVFLHFSNECVILMSELLDTVFTLYSKQLAHRKHNIISYFITEAIFLVVAAFL